MDSRGRISADGEVLNDVAGRVDAVGDVFPGDISAPPAVNDDELAVAGRDATDTLRLSLEALRADLDTFATSVRQTAVLWQEHERAMVALLDEIEANSPRADTAPGPPR